MKRYWVLAFISIVLVFESAAQRNVRDSTLQFFALGFHGGIQQPFGELNDRFGLGGLVGSSLMYKTKSNLTFETKVGFLFSNRVKEDTILKPLLTSQNGIINRNGEFADVFFNERGLLVSGQLGRIFRVGKANVNSGLHVAAGGGYMQHRIFINEASELVPQLVGDYKKGYDRFTSGYMLSQSFGYSHFSSYKLINYYVGFEFYQGFTRNQRAVNFDTGKPDRRQRVDVIGSIVLRWYFPIYKRQAKEFYFY